MDLEDLKRRLGQAEQILANAIVYPPSHADSGQALDALLAVDSAHNIIHAALEEWPLLEPSAPPDYSEEVTQFRRDATLVMLAHGRGGAETPETERYLDFLCRAAFGEGWRQ